MYLENLDAPAAATGLITSVSKSEPAAIIVNDVAGLRNGAAIYVIGTGFASIDGRSWVVRNIDVNTRSAVLANTDTARETGEVSTTGAWVLRSYSDLCVVSYARNENVAAEIDVTTICSEEKEYLVGFSDPGTVTFEFFIDPTDPDYLALRAARADARERMLEIHYRNGAVRTMPVIVQSINETGGVDQAVQGSATLKITGADVLTMPAAEQLPNYVLIPIAFPSIGNVPLEVSLTLNEIGGNASSFEIDWKDGSNPQVVTSHQAVHTYANAGQFQPGVVATIAGEETAPFRSQNIVTVQRLPYSVIPSVEPLEGTAPLEVTLTLAETNGPADRFEVLWDDGSIMQTLTTNTATHTYAANGTFIASIVPVVDGIRYPAVTAPMVSVSPEETR
ncbi:phage tail tube protein [Paraburkholderia sp. BR14312]